MSTESQSSVPRWNARAYSQIESVRYDEVSSIMTVTFADGDQVGIEPSDLVPQSLEDVDWWRVASNHYEIVVPHSSGWFEIPWDVVRLRTDPDFDANWTTVERQIAQNELNATPIEADLVTQAI